MFHRFFLFIASLFVLSCSTQSKEIEVVYEIKKMNDWNFDVSLSILKVQLIMTNLLMKMLKFGRGMVHEIF